MKSKIVPIICLEIRKLIHSRYFMVSCLMLSFAIRLLVVFLLDVEPTSDYGWYYQRGLEIATGKGYSIDGVPTAYWPVGYPGFLGVLFYIFGNSLIIAKLANVLLYSAIILMMYFYSKRMSRSEEAARITLLILAFYPNHIAYGSLLASETFFTFLLVLGVVLFLFAKGRTGFLLLSGIVWGLATLTKPQAILLPLILLLVFYTDFRSLLKNGTLIYLVLFLTLAPWLYRNNLEMGKLVLSTNGGINLLIGNNPCANGSYVWNQELESLLKDTENEIDRDAKAKRMAIGFAMDNPIRTILLWPEKLTYLYKSDVDGVFWNLAGMPEPPAKSIVLTLKIIAQASYVFTVALFLVSLPIIIPKGRHYWIGLILILYFTMIYMAFFGNARFHFPLIPWVAAYSGIGAMALLNRGITMHLNQPGTVTKADA